MEILSKEGWRADDNSEDWCGKERRQRCHCSQLLTGSRPPHHGEVGRNCAHWLPLPPGEQPGVWAVWSLEQGKCTALLRPWSSQSTSALCAAPTWIKGMATCATKDTSLHPATGEFLAFSPTAMLMYSTWAKASHLSFWEPTPEAGPGTITLYFVSYSCAFLKTSLTINRPLSHIRNISFCLKKKSRSYNYFCLFFFFGVG